ncbi:FAD/NAD(P)-binding domain-containing protein [Penicillium hordei]|uniref:FAD/NAD(P)-binding domain-containing protein n=1 Tax=Penicillium hordei TaxID=40994 RepID=A0AAD6DU58_9EURO|nr:FAD/NAD(P)-binding domain-containing protein [Penicillium hordei]KAJ5593231.1 FAD/NAD(P)-binding domain-containing protein [Penicillium hordei]
MAWSPTRVMLKAVLALKFAIYAIVMFVQILGELFAASSRGRTLPSPAPRKNRELQNIVIVGASFAGYHAVRIIATTLPPNTPYRVIMIEPHSHFHFTWVLPRFCVVDGAHKAFIPYGPYLNGAPEGRVQWIQDRVAEVGRATVRLARDGEVIPYAFLVIATGSGANDGLPSRVGADEKREGLHQLETIRTRIRDSKNLVIVGGGAAGVELAADAKHNYPEKNITLVHSRDAVLHRFGPELQLAATKALTSLGVELILGNRTTGNDIGSGAVSLTSGRTVECDFLVRLAKALDEMMTNPSNQVNCSGQRPSSALISNLSPKAISPTGHIGVKSTLQIRDDSLPNVYVCGDVADAGVRNPNARVAMHQATTVANNIVQAATGNSPAETYTPFWADSIIKLTLGLTRSVSHLSDGKAELLWPTKEKDLALMSAKAWRRMGATPFEDHEVPPAMTRL